MEVEHEMSDDKLELIRKLLAKAERTDSDDERDALNERAAALIAKYGIDMALLVDKDGQSTDVIEQREVWLDNPYVLDKKDLLFSVARPLGIKGVWYNRTGNGRQARIRCELVGWKSDLDRFAILFESLLAQAMLGVASARPQTRWEEDEWGNQTPHVPSPAETSSYRKTWLRGFGDAVERRLRAAERKAKADASAAQEAATAIAISERPDTDPSPPPGVSVALVLADRGAQVQAAYREAFPKLSKRSTRRNLIGNGYGDGSVAGERADLGTGQLGSSNQSRQLGR